MLINEEVKFDYWLLKRYGVSVDLKDVLMPNFKAKLQILKKDAALKETIKKARMKLSIHANAHRLTEFYTEIIQQSSPVYSKRILLAHRDRIRNLFGYRPIIKRLIYIIPNRIGRLKRYLSA